ncbi:hypothetical protein OE88DRAFT_1650173 [Heliocybe sulcata]|uniref:Uncharacterized protein n=1 Tax=Heliocybe sulcata TaxID=5364 RepID=A0A5C3NII5_9AGAM|nr:hypothetical protein OE88DRAFT_1650173 [Heliocybe sulcata]
MLGSWFTAKSRREGDTGDSSNDLLSPPRRPSVSQPDGEDLSRDAPAVLSNPHDTILADLMGRSRDTVSPPNANAGAQQGSPIQHGQQEQGSSGVTSAMTAPVPVPASETLYDPFTGAPLGTIHAPESAAGEDPEATRDQLWSHLSQIRELQSDIAAMHVTMEKIGQPDRKRNRKGKAERIVTAALRLRERESVWDTEGEGDTVPGIDTDKTGKKARDQDFDKLADRFAGRKEAINEIMNKLDQLSQAVTQFHALREPSIDFSSRANTATTDPTPTTSPVAQAPAAAAAPPSGHPDLPDVLFSPMQPPPHSDSHPSDTAPSTQPNTSNQLGILLTQQGEDHPVLLDSPSSMESGLPRT